MQKASIANGIYRKIKKFYLYRSHLVQHEREEQLTDLQFNFFATLEIDYIY